jgi:ribosome-binding protein aMBF1 (putative translation factor)
VLNFSINSAINNKYFVDGYPTEIRSLGDIIRKKRMDDGLFIKDLAKLLDVNEGTIINWEIRGIMPMGKNRHKVEQYLSGKINFPVTTKK